MDVSIIIPVYNVEPFILECLQSVVTQSIIKDIKIECIIVDDCGVDRSMSIVTDFIDKYKGDVIFKIIKRQVNGGLSAARNSGIEASEGAFLFFLDSDDLIAQNAIELLWNQKKKYPNAQIICGNFKTFPESTILDQISLSNKNFPEYSNNLRWIRSVFLTTFPIIACNKLVSRKFILDNHLYFREGIIHEDNHWQALAYPYVKCVAFVKSVTYIYRIRAGSITQSDGNNLKRLKNLSLIYEQMFDRDFEWDYDWTLWVFNSLNELKFPQYFNYNVDQARCIYRYLSHILISNMAIPGFIRLLFRYHRFPRLFMRGKVITWSLNKFYARR